MSWIGNRKKNWRKSRRKYKESGTPSPKAERKIKEILKEDKSMMSIMANLEALNATFMASAEAVNVLKKSIEESVLDEEDK